MMKKTFSVLSGHFARSEKARFAFVGLLNTAVDFIVLFGLVTLLGIPSLLANVISTSTALVVSYLLNKRTVFKNTDTHNPRQVFLFVTVTLCGLWILQGLIILLITHVANTWFEVTGNGVLLLAKIIATLFSLTWNYLWYSRTVFKSKNNRESKN